MGTYKDSNGHDVTLNESFLGGTATDAYGNTYTRNAGVYRRDGMFGTPIGPSIDTSPFNMGSGFGSGGTSTEEILAQKEKQAKELEAFANKIEKGIIEGVKGFFKAYPFAPYFLSKLMLDKIQDRPTFNKIAAGVINVGVYGGLILSNIESPQSTNDNNLKLSKSEIATPLAPKPPVSPTLDFFRVTASALNVRALGNTNAPIEAQIEQGSCLATAHDAAIMNGFVRIAVQAAGSTPIDGYVSRQHLQPISKPDSCLATFINRTP